MKAKDLDPQLRALGWTFHRHGKGDHLIYRHPTLPGNLTVPDGRPLHPGLVRMILCQARRGPMKGNP